MARISRFRFWLLCLIFLLPPTSHAQWTSANGPHGPFVNAIAAAGNSLYLSDHLGIHQSGDRGETWQTIGPLFADLYGPNPYSWGLVVLGDTVFVAGETGVHVRAGAGGQWHSANVGLDGDTILNALAYGPEGLVALSWLGGVFRSADRGAHWEHLSLSIETDNSASLALDGAVIYATTKHGLYRSLDKGGTWTHCTLPGPGPDTAAANVACLPPYVFASSVTGIYRSADSGSHWQRLQLGAPGDTLILADLAVTGSHVYATSYREIGTAYVSADSGATWVRRTDFPIPGYPASSPRFAALGNDLFAGTDRGVFRSSDGGATWMERSTGIGCCTVQILDGNAAGSLFAGGEYGLYSSSDEGGHWKFLPHQPSRFEIPTSLLVWREQLLAALPGVGLYRSMNEGDSWESIPTGSSGGDYPVLFQMGAELYYSSRYRVFLHSSDSGKTWAPPPGWNSRAPSSMALCDGIPYAIPWDTVSQTGDTLFRFDRANRIWVAANPTLVDLGPISMGAKGTTLLLGTMQGLMGSTDSGKTFSLLVPESANWGAALCFLPLGGDLYIGTDSGVVVNKAGSSAWELVNAGLPAYIPHRLTRRIYTLHAQDGFLFAGTPTGIWKLPLAATGFAIRSRGRPARRPEAKWTFVSGGLGFGAGPGTPFHSADGKAMPADPRQR